MKHRFDEERVLSAEVANLRSMQPLIDSLTPQKMFSPVFDRQTYQNLLYLALAIPLVILYSMILFFGVVIGLVLTIILVGILILFAVIIGTRLLAEFERRLANGLLTVTIVPVEDLDTTDGPFRRYLAAPSTWRAFGFISLRFWFALIGMVLVAFLYQGIMLVSTVVRRPHDINFGEMNGEPLIWTVETIPEMALAATLGIAVVIVAVHLTNGFAYAAGRMAVSLLGVEQTD